MSPTKTFSEISEEAAMVHHKILIAARNNPEVKSLCQVYQPLFSSLLVMPKNLSVGINPGGRYYNCLGKTVEELDSMQSLKYFLHYHSSGNKLMALNIKFTSNINY